MVTLYRPEDLETFNAHIVGQIRVVSSFGPLAR